MSVKNKFAAELEKDKKAFQRKKDKEKTFSKANKIFERSNDHRSNFVSNPVHVHHLVNNGHNPVLIQHPINIGFHAQSSHIPMIVQHPISNCGYGIMTGNQIIVVKHQPIVYDANNLVRKIYPIR